MDYVTQGITVTADQLFASTKIPVKTGFVKLNGGQGILKRGSIIALDAEKKGSLANHTKTEEQVYGILTDELVTSSEAADYAIAEVYLTGDFNAAALSFAEGTTLAHYETQLRELGIFTDCVMEG